MYMIILYLILVDFLEDYIELLYEDIPGKVKGAGFILQLSRLSLISMLILIKILYIVFIHSEKVMGF